MGKIGTLVLATVAGVGVVPACGDPAPPTAGAPFVDGARLKAVHYEIDGAPPVFLGWHDSALGFECAFENEYLLNQPVCFPSKLSQPVFASLTPLFASGACGIPIAGAYLPEETRYVVIWPEFDDGTRCGADGPRLFHLGDVVPPGTPLFLRDASGACVSAEETAPSQYVQLRLVGAQVPLDELVTGALRHGAGPERIVPLAIDGSDGSVQGAIADATALIAWDNTRDEMVSVSTSLGADSRWYPALAYDARYFSDATCGARAAFGLTCPFTAKAAAIWVPDVCGQSHAASMFALGPPLTDTRDLHASSDGLTCVAVEPSLKIPPHDAFSLGAAIPLTSFAPAIEVRSGAGQLRVAQGASPDGPAFGAIGLYDSVLGQPCSTSHPAADGVLRCLPAAAYVSPDWFADASCSVPLLSGPPPPGACEPAPAFAALDLPATPSTGGPRRHIYTFDGPHTGSVYFRLVGGECFFVGSDGLGLFAGTEIPAASFAPVTLVNPGGSR